MNEGGTGMIVMPFRVEGGMAGPRRGPSGMSRLHGGVRPRRPAGLDGVLQAQFAVPGTRENEAHTRALEALLDGVEADQ